MYTIIPKATTEERDVVGRGERQKIVTSKLTNEIYSWTQKKAERKRNIEQVVQIENKQWDGRFILNHISNNSRCKLFKHLSANVEIVRLLKKARSS